VTQFDLIVAALLAISAAVGFARGAIREIAAMAALVVAALLAIYGLPATAPIARHLIHAQWLAAVAALVGVFVIVYAVLRLMGAGVARQVQRTHVLGVLDRTVGLGIGVVRGLAVLGGLYLMFIAATPEDLQPRWITGSATWPVARSMGGLITRLAPQGFHLAARARPAFDRVVKGGSGDRRGGSGYDARSHGETDGQVENSP
jgi:membrane protein required for colicin V production